MNGAILLALVALLGLHQGAIEVQAEPKSRLNDTARWESSLVESAVLIFHLRERVEKLKERLKTKPVDLDHIYRKVKNAVDRLEGTGCKENELQCGSIERQCVSKLLICDGVKDCVNGHDEEASYCDVSKIHAGLSFSGWFTEGSCLQGNRRNLYFCKMVVTSVTRRSAFKSLLPMKMTSNCKQTVLGLSAEEQAPADMSYSITGHYQIANRRWFSESGQYSSFCSFPDDSFKMLRCETFIGQTNRCNTGIIAYRDED